MSGVSGPYYFSRVTTGTLSAKASFNRISMDGLAILRSILLTSVLSTPASRASFSCERPTLALADLIFKAKMTFCFSNSFSHILITPPQILELSIIRCYKATVRGPRIISHGLKATIIMVLKIINFMERLMKKHLLIAALTTIAASTTYAQSKFEGFYGQAGVGYFSGAPTLSNSSITSPAGENFPQTSSIDSTSGFNGLLSAGYTFNLNKQYTLGLGIDYQPFSGQSGNYSQANANLVPNPNTGTYKITSASSIYLAPGIALTPDSLLYAKVGYSMVQVKISPTGGTGTTTDYSGYLLGLGYKQIIKGGLYGFGEINYSSYGNKTTPGSGPWGGVGGGTYTSTSQASINAFNTIVGVGYRF